jgi:NhaA family Na+:H+ antiporter
MATTVNYKLFREFVRSGSFGGILLLFCVTVSLFIANSGFHSGFEKILATSLGPDLAFLHLRYTTLQWINDGFMAVFFLLVGLEIKREVVDGELSSFKHASLPVFCAIGGAIIPAAIYYLLNRDSPSANGWGIPMATDIAFALGILSLLGKRVPASLKIFLATLAIADDLIAILMIAIFYSGELQMNYLLYAAILVAVMFTLNKFKIKNLAFYLIPGALLWYCIHHSGIHATIAGVLTAMTIPSAKDSNHSPLETLEHALTRPVNFLIMPIFALANTNIHFEPGMIGSLSTTMGIGIILGLFVGKPVGVLLAAWITTKTKLASLPRQAKWIHILGIGLLGGIGFTMSIFISLLSFSDVALQSESKFAVLITSILAGVCGFGLLYFNSRKNSTT